MCFNAYFSHLIIDKNQPICKNYNIPERRRAKITIDETLKHIDFLAKLFGRNNVRYVIVVLLLELGIPTNYDGFDYLIQAITIYHTDPSQMIMKGLYPAVAKTSQKNVDGQHVESSIRTAIKIAWKYHDDIAWKRYFSETSRKPSNTEFVSKIARVLELWEGCCEEYELKNEEEAIM